MELNINSQIIKLDAKFSTYEPIMNILIVQQILFL
jgi:hypothetical protein